jgi:hypothetical protein
VNRRSRFNVLGVSHTHSNDTARRGDSDPASDAWQLQGRPIANQQEPSPERQSRRNPPFRSELLPHPVRYRCLGQARSIKK